MPHLFTNRPRRHNLVSEHPAGHRHFSWEAANAILYVIGGATFIAGSICFLPTYEDLGDLGAWIFFGGSLLYLIVTVHDLLESIIYWNKSTGLDKEHWLEFIAARVYVAGTLLFIVGSILFLSSVGMITGGAWCFIIGSFLFFLGACVNVLQITQAGSTLTLQLLNATAITFVVGSILFLVASVPYLWQVADQSDRFELFTYLAWQYIFGSILFFAGGVFNFCRAYEVARRDKAVAAIGGES